MFWPEEDWKKTTQKLADYYAQNPQIARRQLKNHRYFISVPNSDVNWVSGHQALCILRSGVFNVIPRSGQNHKNLRANMDTAGFVEINQGHLDFEAVWRSYMELCRKFETHPSGGPKKPKRARTFFLPASSVTPIDLPPAGGKIPTGKEGASFQATSNRYERDPSLREACAVFYMEKDGRLSCQVCGMDFASRYGEIGRGFIHIHHLDPLGNGQGVRNVDPVKDLIPVCPNCHAMLHKKPGKGVYTPEELRERLKKRQAKYL